MAVNQIEDAAVAHFAAIIWKNGEFCPHCGHDHLYHFEDKRLHKCAKCREKFSIRFGTIFEDSRLPLYVWMQAILFISLHKNGVASSQLADALSITQKTAWLMLKRLRYASRTKSFNRQLGTS